MTEMLLRLKNENLKTYLPCILNEGEKGLFTIFDKKIYTGESFYQVKK